MQIQSIFGIISIIAFVYLIIKKYYLDSTQLCLIVSAMLMSTSLLLPQYLTYLFYLVLMTWQSFIVMCTSKKTFYFDLKKPQKHHNKFIQIFFRLNQQQIFLILYAIIIWLWIRVFSLKSLTYQIQQNVTFLQYLHGWNCTLAQFWSINLICFSLMLLSLLACVFLIQNETQKNYLYKMYLLKYKIITDVLVSLIVTVYNYWVYSSVSSLSQCLSYYQNGELVRILWFWGYPLSTLIFIYVKHGVFLVQNNSEKAQKQNNLDEQFLDHYAIDRQYSQKSKTFSAIEPYN